jgi:hypothetical protein
MNLFLMKFEDLPKEIAVLLLLQKMVWEYPLLANDGYG